MGNVTNLKIKLLTKLGASYFPFVGEFACKMNERNKFQGG